MSDNVQGKDEQAAVAGLIVIVTFFALYHYFFEYFLYVWKFFYIPLIFTLKTMPGFITDILFFWTHYSVREQSAEMYDLITSSPVLYLANDPNGQEIVANINGFIGYLLAPYTFFALFYQGFKIFTKKSFTKKYSVDTLSVEESKLWKQIKPVVFVHPELEPDLNKGPWAMGIRPEDFVKKFNLIEEEETDAGDIITRLNTEKTYNQLLKQMGRKWNGLDALTMEERQLFGVFVTKARRKGKEAKELVDALADAYTSERFGFFDKIIKARTMKKTNKLIDEKIKKYYGEEKGVFILKRLILKIFNKKPTKPKPNKDISKIIDSHFYVKTVLSGLLEEARKDGVLATADFIWLKKQNRELWYMLNNIGRRASWVECAAPWNHFLAEKLLERKVANPMINNSIDALDEYLENCDENYQPFSQEEDEEESEI